ncbi:MAG: hypothetical protein ACREMQ_10425 [Longimicrobiales bacterium]
MSDRLLHRDASSNPLPRDKLPPDAQRMRSWTLSQVKHYAANDNPFEGEELAIMLVERTRGEHLLGARPRLVLTGGLDQYEGPEAQTLEEERQRYQADRVRLSRVGKQVNAQRSGHHIQLEEPELVIQAIRDVLAASRR